MFIKRQKSEFKRGFLSFSRSYLQKFENFLDKFFLDKRAQNQVVKNQTYVVLDLK